MSLLGLLLLVNPRALDCVSDRRSSEFL
jgi:hypothetical protein